MLSLKSFPVYLAGLLFAGLLSASTFAQSNCEYRITSEWNSGYIANIRINNSGVTPINNWSVRWIYQNNIVTNLWNAQFSGNNPYTAASLSWNNNIAPGGYVEFGFQVNKNNGAAEVPFINGAVCGNSGIASSNPSSSNTVSSIGFSSSLGSCPFTGHECQDINGSWMYICAGGCTSQGNVSCRPISECRFNYSSSASSTISSSFSSASSNNPSTCPFTGHECIYNGLWEYICAPGCNRHGHWNCIQIRLCGTYSTSSAISSLSSISASSSSWISTSSSFSSVNSSSASSSANVQLKVLADFPVGVAVSAGNESNTIFGSSSSATVRRLRIEQHFDQITPGNIMKMSYLHPGENTYTFEHADQLVNYALSNNLSVHGHTLVWHSDYQIPEWMKNYNGDYSSMLQGHVQTIVNYYAGRVVSWDVVNEAFADDGDSDAINGYRNSLWYQKIGPAYIEQAFIAADAADPAADLYYNDYNIEGGQQKFDYVLAMVDDFKARGIPIDGVGFQMHINIEWPSETQIKNAFQQIVNRGLKVKITELDIPVNTYANPDKYLTFTNEAAERQKEKYREVVAAYVEVVPPALRGGITVWGVFDSDSWLIDLHGREDWPLLFRDQGEPKPALEGFAEGLAH